MSSNYNHVDPTDSQAESNNPNLSELKVYRFVMFCVPILFTFVLLFLFYVFYLRPRRVNWSSLRMRTTSPPHNQHHFLAEVETGLKKEVREMLPIIVFRESFSVRDTQCSVCLGDYEADDRLQQIPACGHTFHMDCIDNWLATHTTCPLCRLSLLSSAKSPSRLANIRVLSNASPSNASDGESILQQQVVDSSAHDTAAMHGAVEENTGRPHCLDCDLELEPMQIKGQGINA